MIWNELTKKPDINCTKCKGTGIIKFKPIDAVTMYSWIPWEKRPCDCCKYAYGELQKQFLYVE